MYLNQWVYNDTKKKKKQHWSCLEDTRELNHYFQYNK